MRYQFSLLQEKENMLDSPNAMAVYNHWTGLVDWTRWTGPGGLDPVDWTGGLDPVDWTGGLTFLH